MWNLCVLWCTICLSSWLIAAATIFDRFYGLFWFLSCSIIRNLSVCHWVERPQCQSSFAALFDWHIYCMWNYKRKSLNTQKQNTHTNTDTHAFRNQFNAFDHFIHQKEKVSKREKLAACFLLTSKPDLCISIEWISQKKKKEMTERLIFIDNGFGWKQWSVFWLCACVGSFILISWFKTNRLNRTI